MSKKERLLFNLQNDTYVRLQPSSVQGVGVFAVKDIPRGIDPFKTPIKIKYGTIKLTKSEINSLNPGVKKMVKDFIDPSGDFYYVPENGLNSLDISFYLNHSETNNLEIIEGDGEYLSFITIRPIKRGEELTINYGEYKNID